MDDLLPSDLCKICHTNPTKYCCPRCSTRTCSLPCTKRHKQWAQCSGVRDPTVYLPRAELASPRGIDHDYNFLTSIERKLEGAERDTSERGVVLRDNDERGGGWRNGGRNGPVKGEVRLRDAMEKCGVIVRKAPTGLARAKQNKTFWNPKKKHVVWTVEWIHNDGRSELGLCPAHLPVCEAYAAQRAPGTQNKKRKRVSEPSPPSPPATSHIPPRPSPFPPASNSSALSSPMAERSLHFYLLRPCTPPSTRVLIPLTSSMATLTTSLRDRLVLEFPTIYALKYPPQELPTGFVTEAEYLAQRRGLGTDREEDEGTWRDGATRNADGDIGEGVRADGAEGEELMDENRLLAVLSRDLGT